MARSKAIYNYLFWLHYPYKDRLQNVHLSKPSLSLAKSILLKIIDKEHFGIPLNITVFNDIDEEIKPPVIYDYKTQSFITE